MVHCGQRSKKEEAHVAEGDRVQVQILGRLDERWREWFDGWTVGTGQTADGRPITLLASAAADQAALRGLLCRIWDLNLVVLAVTCESPPQQQVRLALNRAKEREL
jgi:hypothetical protein